MTTEKTSGLFSLVEVLPENTEVDIRKPVQD